MSTRKRFPISEGNCFFVTSTFRNRLNLLTSDDHYQIIIDSLEFCLKKYRADLIAYVLMPNHVHLVLFLNDIPRISDFMRDFKKFTAVKIRRNYDREKHADILDNLRFNRGEQKYKVWDDRYDMVLIKHESVLETKVNYIHLNPVRKKLVERAEDWKYSSAAYYSSGEAGFLNVRNVGEVV